LRVEAYASAGLLEIDPSYADKLRSVDFDVHGSVLVAVDETDGELLGTVMLAPWGPGSLVASDAGEAEVRMLAVSPRAQRRGVGRALMAAVIEAAADDGVRTLLLSTNPKMAGAEHIYRSLGFVRMPERDYEHVPGFTAFTYQLPLTIGSRTLPAADVAAAHATTPGRPRAPGVAGRRR
jgi:ribosomal protein S18 acetylase RimI-like enzyme